MSVGVTQTVMDNVQGSSNGAYPADDVSTELEAALNSIALGNNAADHVEPEITPIRTRSPPMTPRKSIAMDGHGPEPTVDSERGRQDVKGSVILSTTAAKRKKKRHNKAKAAQAFNTVRGFTPVDSGAEDSDTSHTSPRVLSPNPRLRPLAGASPGLRPQSPGISSLKAQLDALNSHSQSRSTSRARNHQLDSEATSSAASAASDTQGDEPQEEMVSYNVPIDQDFVSQSLADTEPSAASTFVMPADQRATTMIARKMTAADFTAIRCLGDGAFGTVLLVRQNATGRLFAQKQLTKAFLKVHKKRIESTKSERSILELVNRHPFIVNLYYAFQDHEKLYLILEYASGGELFRHLELEKFFSEEVAAFYVAEIVLALDYLHNTVGVIYRDLKPENCLLDAEGHLLLTDFGLSKVAVQDAETPGGSRCNSLGVGTIEYMAPEIIRGSDESDWGPGYGKSCDWWSLGAMACDLMTGKPPFGGGNWTKIQQNILHQKLSLPYFLSADAKDLLTRFLRKEPKKRLGVGPNDITIIKKHRFFRKIDWKKLEARELEPPIRPLVTDPELAENFSREFTGRSIETITRRHSRTLSKSDPFGGFSYVASHSLLEESMLSELDEAIIDEDI
ncbi:AGC/RSK/RSKP70 protein kinase [Capronia epimyces CBS 606.96]|uniref:AGC/RSK/RSKP70 protein kinase n=1 Tax=Capronia epimyces CBS 606.96 TaxID=1182542 RepID=W9YBS7_9EURO|nr:AGC/RSK/RSKP70 protein kinase [Capronia epimyces CBS 606.96]EXJ86716.1 AGC/RSK/RSKP70 protein kinase [Capronia epimyces CBS 606.96]